MIYAEDSNLPSVFVFLGWFAVPIGNKVGRKKKGIKTRTTRKKEEKREEIK